MRAEPWMNREPVPTKTPLQIAESDFQHWSDRLRAVTKELVVCESELSAARERVEKLKPTF